MSRLFQKKENKKDLMLLSKDQLIRKIFSYKGIYIKLSNINLKNECEIRYLFRKLKKLEDEKTRLRIWKI